MIKKVCLFYKPNKESKKQACEIRNFLKKNKISVYSYKDQFLKDTNLMKKNEKPDLFLVVGGDGTYLEQIRRSHYQKIPFLGFNKGSLGFLTKHKIEEKGNILKDLLKNKLKKKKYFMIDVEVIKKDKNQTYTALNDVVLERGNYSQLVECHVFSNKILIGTFRSDGLIISTPTGSTAYNLSAGGPIIDSSLENIVVTPICPHSLHHRPIILSAQSKIQIEIKKPKNKFSLSVDGYRIKDTGFLFKLKKSKHSHICYLKKEIEFFDVLREKFRLKNP